jgi:hypothetical protein
MVLAGLMRNTKQVCVAADGKTKGEIQGSFTAFRMTTLEGLRSVGTPFRMTTLEALRSIGTPFR